ncbi:MAG: ABC transporter ATP-binding protein [Erysipelotrichaceae bacterium]|nr:ABC transporter ATP-binding protein [Erysipelotrichaceae bacterium]
MENNCAVEFRNITKRFGHVTANEDVSFDIRKNEILALLGENGSGKTTVMNMLAGIYYPDEGEIFVNGQLVSIKDPKDAFDLGIGMIHQHFKLIDVFTAIENIVLGLEDKTKSDVKYAREKVREICERYGFELDQDLKVYDMNVSQKQTLEIVKTLYRGADILILDEPTTVLTPQETEKLFKVLRNMRQDGKAIVIITHKLNEVLEISDRVTILRKGRYVGTVETAKTTEQQLTEMMVGEKITLDIRRDFIESKTKRLEVKNVTVINIEKKKVIDDISFDLYSGEVLGIAGISGSGQKELLEAIMGLQKIEPGASIIYHSTAHGDHELVGLSTKEIISFGLHLAFVPEDRLGMGLVGNMGMTDNVLLKRYRKGSGPFLHKEQPHDTAIKIKDELDVQTPDLEYPVRRLSGGNVQKVLVGREINNKPTVLMTAYAVRGLDINTSYAIYNLLNEQKKKGVAVIYVGEDLDVLLALCDRILVLCAGKVNGILDGRKATKEEVGLLMTNLKGGSNE